MSSYLRTIDYLYGLKRLGIRPGLAAIKRLLAALKNPEGAFSSVHVAGTNGKGSTSAFIESMLEESGLTTGLYTSPHLMRFNERIRIGGVEVSDEEVVETAEKVKRAAEREFCAESEAVPTFFEFVTAMAFELFRMRGVEVAVVETGMGGSFDATNTITPLVSVITNIGLDHTRHLGEDLESIAMEKAGIIKAGAPVVTAEAKRAPLKVLRDVSRERDARLYRLGVDFDFVTPGSDAGFNYSGIHGTLSGLRINLRGAHQYKNAALALAAVEAVREAGLPVDGPAIKEGLKKAFWPGRLEVMGEKPLVIIDCAHNPSGAAALRGALSELLSRPSVILVAGLSKDKDIDGFFSPLMDLPEKVILTMADNERAAEAGLLAERIRHYHKAVIVKKGVRAAVTAALKEARPEGAVLITGSIFIAGEAREFLLKSFKAAGPS